jgi:MFS transporter, ACS family, solute carrier family 17 (sodium-dependent inorganic phosphate cotransporter), other
MISHWAPKEEKGKFISALLGGILGNIVTWGVLGNIIEKFGWQYGFYIPSFITLAFLGFWYWQVTDYPEEHPTISDKEKQLIQKSIGDGSKSEKQMAPIKSILTSIPFYALMILQYGNVWGLYSLQTAAPKFMTEALNFNLSHAGYLSSLPLLARLLCGFAFGFIGDYIAKRNFMSTTTTRKTFCLVCKYKVNVNLTHLKVLKQGFSFLFQHTFFLEFFFL